MWDVEAADIDDDGDTDVVAAARFGDGEDYSWWENTTGDGTGWTKHVIGAPEPPGQGRGVHAADVDGDGDLDALGAAYNAYLWWENVTGDGTLWIERTVDAEVAGSIAESVAAADLDADGDLDVLGMGDLYWYENTMGNGTAWTKRPVDSYFQTGYSVEAADIDGDGDPDVLGCSLANGHISWWENDLTSCSSLTTDHSGLGADPIATPVADGTFPPENVIDGGFSGATSAKAADLDGDGDWDVVAAAETFDAINWVENVSGDGSTWTKRPIASGVSGPNAVHVADVDGDGDTDVVASLQGDTTVAWSENVAGDGSVWSHHVVDDDALDLTAVASADLDGDGDEDVLAAYGQLISWWENVDGAGTSWAEHPLAGAFLGASSVSAVDLDGDGDADVLASAEDAEEIAWWENIGDGSAWTRRNIDASYQGATSAWASDVDGDGDLDVVGAAVDYGQFGGLDWFENLAGDGTSWQEHQISDKFAKGPSGVITTDLDGDGDRDIIGAYTSWNDVIWWENVAGDGSRWNSRAVGNFTDDADSVDVADFDGDGDPDVLATAPGNDTIQWWENTYGGICPTAGEYPEGGPIALLAAPDPGWRVESWEGTDDDLSTELENRLTMPDVAHQVTAHYVEEGSNVALSITGGCPGAIQLAVSSATPSGAVAIVFSPSEGASVVPVGACAGTPLGLDGPSLLTVLPADGNGEVSLDRNAPAGACGLYLQAVDISSCETSNVAQVP